MAGHIPACITGIPAMGINISGMAINNMGSGGALNNMGGMNHGYNGMTSYSMGGIMMPQGVSHSIMQYGKS